MGRDGYFPAVAVGINDLVGTGVYSGEYVVASKRLGDFEANLGMGWGRLGNTALFRNPLATVFNSFRNRIQYPDIRRAAQVSTHFFTAHSSGLFGGVIWHTPIKRLSLIAEYSSDTYAVEAMRGNFRPHNQMNYGALL